MKMMVMPSTWLRNVWNMWDLLVRSVVQYTLILFYSHTFAVSQVAFDEESISLIASVIAPNSSLSPTPSLTSSLGPLAELTTTASSSNLGTMASSSGCVQVCSVCY